MVGKWICCLAGLGMVLFLATGHIHSEDRLSPTGSTSVMSARAQGQLSPEERQSLLRLARQALKQYLKEGAVLEVAPESLSPALQQKKGCFVTLLKNNDLRGCIGSLAPREPLCRCVIENAINAAVNDPRFPLPVSLEELGSLRIEISALTVPEKLETKRRVEILNDLVPGRDGVILQQGRRESTYLPQVWEHFPDKVTFLNSLCQKGGWEWGCWEDPNTEIYTYRAEVFHE